VLNNRNRVGLFRLTVLRTFVRNIPFLTSRQYLKFAYRQTRRVAVARARSRVLPAIHGLLKLAKDYVRASEQNPSTADGAVAVSTVSDLTAGASVWPQMRQPAERSRQLAGLLVFRHKGRTAPGLALAFLFLAKQ
jgi:hypothetical protein